MANKTFILKTSNPEDKVDDFTGNYICNRLSDKNLRVLLQTDHK